MGVLLGPDGQPMGAETLQKPPENPPETPLNPPETLPELVQGDLEPEQWRRICTFLFELLDAVEVARGIAQGPRDYVPMVMGAAKRRWDVAQLGAKGVVFVSPDFLQGETLDVFECKMCAGLAFVKSASLTHLYILHGDAARAMVDRLHWADPPMRENVLKPRILRQLHEEDAANRRALEAQDRQLAGRMLGQG